VTNAETKTLYRYAAYLPLTNASADVVAGSQTKVKLGGNEFFTGDFLNSPDGLREGTTFDTAKVDIYLRWERKGGPKARLRDG